MESIKVKYNGPKTVARVLLKGDIITVEALEEKDKKGIEELVDHWSKLYKAKGKKLFNLIPTISSSCSRIFFSNITKEKK